jgi:hypothetical protein
MAQELLALIVAAFALVYLVYKIGGWPRFSSGKKQGAPVVLGRRLARGLKSTRR